MFSNYDILIIEDEKVVIDSAKKILIPEGFKVDDTFSVDKALQKLKQNKYKLILTDLMLPKISGIELTEIVTQKYPDIPIIIITGYATLENAVQSLKVG
ncbi:MAG: response regulator, partial [Calditrichae bacterium]|nr:response regulator [Calditrichia bacterium]